MNYEWEWELVSCSVLGGIEMNLSQRFDKSVENPRLNSLGCSRITGGSPETAISKFRSINKHITQAFRAPDTYKKNDSANWIINGSSIELSVWERFDWFCGIYFSKL